jgi:hypothetical protein
MKSESQSRARHYLQERGEVILRFAMPPGISIDYLSTFLSVDKFRHDTVVAYANDIGYYRFLSLKVPHEVVPPPSLKFLPSRPVLKEKYDWRDHYPSYSEYVNLMEGFAAAYPDLCRLTQFGTSVKGHKLLALKISDHPGAEENEPVVLYTSTMHGNEPLGYVLMLRLIDHLLASHGTSQTVTDLVNQLEIWINPLFNPDGTYFNSDTSLVGAKRFNANNTDLNRNFPDPRDYGWESVKREPETIAMMEFMKDIGLVLAANFHGGAEVVNYPWDTWMRLHPDDPWYRYISRSYADTVHMNGPPGYLTDLENGITNGHDWYAVYGGRQDYVNYFLHAREVTIELSEAEMPPENSLNDFWIYNKNSLLQYMGQALNGIRGTVTDSITGMPLEAIILIEDHDYDNSYVLSSPEDGVYYRLINTGSYTVRISAPDYGTKRLLLSVPGGGFTVFDAALEPLAKTLYPNPFSETLYLYISGPGNDLQLEFFDLLGRKVLHIVQPVVYPGRQTIPVKGLASGIYAVRITYGRDEWKQMVVRNNSVTNE